MLQKFFFISQFLPPLSTLSSTASPPPCTHPPPPAPLLSPLMVHWCMEFIVDNVNYILPFFTFLCSGNLFPVRVHAFYKADSSFSTPCYPAEAATLTDIAPVEFLNPCRSRDEVSFQIEFSPTTCCSWLFVLQSRSFLKPDIFVWSLWWPCMTVYSTVPVSWENEENTVVRVQFAD